jgi:hypothetical protein
MVTVLALSVIVVALVAVAAVEIARRSDRAIGTPDPYVPYRQTVEAFSQVTPTLDAYSRGLARVQTMVAGLPTPASSPAWPPTPYPDFTLGDVYRCAEAYARGQGGISPDCWDETIDACVREFFSSTSNVFSYKCDVIIVSGTGSPATHSQIEDCVRAAYGEISSPFAAMNCDD